MIFIKKKPERLQFNIMKENNAGEKGVHRIGEVKIAIPTSPNPSQGLISPRQKLSPKEEYSALSKSNLASKPKVLKKPNRVIPRLPSSDCLKSSVLEAKSEERKERKESVCGDGYIDSDEETELGEDFSEDVIKTGWLSKMGSKSKVWERRWFVLNSSLLVFYENKTLNYSKTKCKGSVKISGGFVVVEVKDDETFKLVISHISKVFKLKASSKEEKMEWMNSLQALSKRIISSPSPEGIRRPSRMRSEGLSDQEGAGTMEEDLRNLIGRNRRSIFISEQDTENNRKKLSVSRLIKRDKRKTGILPQPVAVASQFAPETVQNSLERRNASERYLFGIYKYETPAPFNFVILQNVQMIACGSRHMLFLTELTREVWCQGDGSFGQLGHGTTASCNAPRRIDLSLAVGEEPIFVVSSNSSAEASKTQNMASFITARGRHSALITTKGHLYLWGDMYDKTEPIVTKPTQRCKDKRFLEVALGESHVLALLSGDPSTVLCWGLNVYNCLGISNETLRKYDNPSVIDLKEEIKSVSSYLYNSAALTTKGKVYYWGQSWAPLKGGKEAFLKPIRLTLPSNKKIEKFAVGKDFIIAVDEDSEIYSAGGGRMGTLGTSNKEQYSDEFVKVQFAKPPEEKPALPPQPAQSSLSSYQGSVSKEAKRKNSITVLSEVAQWRKKNGIPTNENMFTFTSVNSQIDSDSQFTDPSLLLAFKKSQERSEDPKQCDIQLSCANTYAMVIKQGKIFAWGSVGNGEDVSIELLSATPVPQLDQIQLQEISCGEGQVIAKVGLMNQEKLRFSSFIPPVVHCGTLEGLVEYLISPQCTNGFIYTFFLTYKTFASGIEVLEMLLKKTEETKKKDRLTSEIEIVQIIRAVSAWLKRRTWGNDPFEEEKLFEKMREFIEQLSQSEIVKEKLSQLLLKELKPYPSIPEKYAVFSSGGTDITNQIFASTPKHVAEQICLTEQFLFKAILTVELLGQKWSKKGTKMKEAPNVTCMIEYFNNCSNWAATKIVLAESNKERNARLNFVVEVMEECIKYNNFFAAMWLFSALSGTAIYKLRKSKVLNFKARSQQMMSTFKSLLRNNNSKYRKLLEYCKKTNTMAIPFLGLHLSDLTFMEDGASDSIEGGSMINFAKRIKISKVIETIEFFQGLSYPFKQTSISKYFFFARGFTSAELEKELASLSLPRESRTAKSEVSAEAKLPEPTFHSHNLQTTQSAEALRRRLEIQVRQTKLQGRSALWSDWLQNLDSNRQNLSLSNGERITYRDAFNRSKALELCIEGVLEKWPTSSSEEGLFKKLLNACFGKNLDEAQLQSLVESLRLFSTESLDQEHRQNIVASMASIKYFDNMLQEKLMHPNELEDSESENELKSKMAKIERDISLLAEANTVLQSVQSEVDPSFYEKMLESFVEKTTEEESRWMSLQEKRESLVKSRPSSVKKVKHYSDKEKQKMNEEVQFLALQEKELQRKLKEVQLRMRFLRGELHSSDSSPQQTDSATQLLELESEIEKVGESAKTKRKVIFHLSNFIEAYKPLYEKCLNDNNDFTQFTSSLLEEMLFPTFEQLKEKLTELEESSQSVAESLNQFSFLKQTYSHLNNLCFKLIEMVEFSNEDLEALNRYSQGVSEILLKYEQNPIVEKN